ncbi:hypothetical protein FSARC_5883 [Fusarium sarcochroum]|uniref:Uncharacterized protein n=1 Tax=Fusarium sarcochroum TaxID=1208366 RepID=A0A8H4X9Z5_9HYPO|nr:hypothetical protein FSARC_5883 [Fusarium sarcochroum]
MNEHTTLPSPSAHRIMAGGRKDNKQDTQPWTAARCQRILRQLQCRLVALRKLVQEARQPATTTRAKRTSTDEEPTRPSKRARYTYGRRRSAPAQPKSTASPLSTPPRAVRTLGTMKIERSPPGAGRVDFATPFLRKIHRQDPTVEMSPPSSKATHTNSAALLTELQSLRRIVPDSQYRIYEAIFGWLGGLLSSTDPLSQTAHPKSLLGMCLRKVPGALAVIEEWDRQAAAKEGSTFKWESSKASTELYEQLEGFGTASLGWKSLRLVVRAHALCLLAEAVTEGLLEPPFVRLLADLCLSLGCNEEASRLVSSIKFPLAAPCGSSSTLAESSTVQPLGAIVRSLQGRRLSGPSWDCLTSLIKNKKLSLSWLTSRGFQSVWKRGVEILLHSRLPVPSVVDFMCTALDQLVLNDGKAKETEQTPEDQTLASVLAAMTAAAWTLGAEMDDGLESWRTQAVRRLLYTLECCVVQQQSRRGAFRSSGLFVVVLARFMATAMIDNDVVKIASKHLASRDCARLLTVRNGSPTQPQYRQTLLLACSVAQYRGRACGLPCHDILSEIRTTLNGLGLPDWFHDGLISDGAFVLAQKTKDLRDVAFAERFPAAGKGTLETSTMFSGWRWEEGIGEWVLPSPGLKTRGELRQENINQNGTSCQTGTDRQQDGLGRVNGLRWNRACQGTSPRNRDDEDSSVGSDKDAGNRDDTDDTEGEDDNDTSATTVTDIDEQQDSGDELGDCARTIVYGRRETLGREGNNNGNSNSRKITTVKAVKKVRRLGISRILQRNKLMSQEQHGEDDMNDELGML